MTQRAAYRTAISAAQILVFFLNFHPENFTEIRPEVADLVPVYIRKIVYRSSSTLFAK